MTEPTDQLSSEPVNEIVAAARAAAAQRERLRKALPIAVGIGSAALAAALLYANRTRRES